MYVHLKNHEVFAFAGIWERWQNPEGDEIRTCTILTTEPNDLLKSYHHRMAVILPKEDYELWLSEDELPPTALKPLLGAYNADKMGVYQVSTQVNNVSNDMPNLIEPYQPPQQQTLL